VDGLLARGFDGVIFLVSFGHMSGLLMRLEAAGLDDIRQLRSLIIAASLGS
jgi:hypothetical protein